MLDIRHFRQHQVEYKRDQASGVYRHNFDRDLHLFIIWPGGRSRQGEILADLATEFSVLAVAEIQWSRDLCSDNAARLYKNWHFRTHAPQKIGDGRVLLIVLEDLNPEYVYDRTASGLVQCTNRRVSGRKRKYRTWLDGYDVHSSNSIAEFFEQLPLIVGPARTREILERDHWDGTIEELHRDLEGSEGWTDFSQLFETLAQSCNFVVLRNFEYLPDDLYPGDSDLDLLCADLDRFRAAANVTAPTSGRQPHRGFLKVAGRNIPVDVRHVGDNYFDPLWERDMLRRQIEHRDVVPRPREDDYFFSLLYHAKLQKREVKADYADRLPELAHFIGLERFSLQDVVSDEAAAGILGGFMEAHGYRFVLPHDRGVVLNHNVIRRLPPPTARVVTRRGSRARQVLVKLRKLVPQPLRAAVPRRLKLAIRRHLGL